MKRAKKGFKLDFRLIVRVLDRDWSKDKNRRLEMKLHIIRLTTQN
jgi:hypothetical protein